MKSGEEKGAVNFWVHWIYDNSCGVLESRRAVLLRVWSSLEPFVRLWSTQLSVMKTRLSSILAFLTVCGPSVYETMGQPSETVVMAERPKLAIYSEDVTVDGVSRPEIGRAVADSLAANLLKRGQVRVFNLESAAAASQSGMLTSRSPSSASPMNRLLDRDLDYLVTFSVLSNTSSHLVTVKKMRAQSHEIVEAHQFTAFGGIEQIFGMMPSITEKLDPMPYVRRTSFPITQSPSELRPELVQVQRPAIPVRHEPRRLHPVVVEASRDEPVISASDLRNVPKALVYRRIGSIQLINPIWKFCIIRPEGKIRVGNDHPLHVLYEDGRGDVYGDLRVSALDGGRIVADFSQTPPHHPLFNGDEVYGWAPAGE